MKKLFKSSNLKIAETKPASSLQAENAVSVVSKEKSKFKTYKMNIEAIKELELLKKTLDHELPIDISRTKILEALIFKAAKQPREVIKLFQRR